MYDVIITLTFLLTIFLNIRLKIVEISGNYVMLPKIALILDDNIRNTILYHLCYAMENI